VFAAINDALYKYVASVGPDYSWSDLGVRIEEKGYTGYVLNMTSGRWLNDTVVSRSLWWHHLVVIRPHNIHDERVGALMVGEGKNTGTPYEDDPTRMMAGILAQETRAMTAVLYQVPNQPTVFYNDPELRGRGEDALVAYSWMQYVKTGDPEFASYLPMTRAAVRAMDTITAFTKQQGWSSKGVEKFIVAGASKRGATTWLTGAYEGSLPIEKRRVLGIAPIVFDMLRFETGVAHMYEAYGNWTFAFKDYVREGVTEILNTPDMARLTEVVDPFSYKEELANIPKLVISATGDEFFMPDDDWYWWDSMEGDNFRLHVANAEHSMATGIPTVLKGIRGFFNTLREGTMLPAVETIFELGVESSNVTAATLAKPSKVTLWRATTITSVPNRRDFRMIKKKLPGSPCPVPMGDEMCFNPIVWVGMEAVVKLEDGRYVARHTEHAPANGDFRGFFFEFEFPGPDSTQVVTSQIGMVPNILPFPPCGSGKSCRGDLV
jgi:PhoPQ-activated pathogenicity-related protein